MNLPLPRGVLAALCLAGNLMAASRDAQWNDVEQAVEKGLPQTAIAALEPILAAALAENVHAEAIRALCLKIVLEGNIQGNRPEEKIERLQATIGEMPAPMRPVLEAVLAHWYWHFYQQNRWRFHQRTQTAEAPGDDIETWDLARILAEIDRHFTAALADDATLKATSVSLYGDLIEEGSAPDSYRPTLFDFLAYEALQFYQAGENGPVIAEDAFEIDATASPIFENAHEFIAWDPAASDETAPLVRAIRLFQELLRFHESDADRSAWYDADLSRLEFGRNFAVGEEKDARYQAALERFIAETKGHEISARALHALARLVHDRGDFVEAHAIAERGLESFPESAGAAMCYNLIQEIEARSLAVETERVWNPPWPTLDVTYRNLTQVHFRAVPVDFVARVEAVRWNYDHVDISPLRRKKPALTWSADLPATPDYHLRTEHLAVPTTLAPGLYSILASHDADFTTDNNVLSHAFVWVSDLALITESRSEGDQERGFVLHANSGEPIAGVRVRMWTRDNEGRFRRGESTLTDENGRFALPEPGDHRDFVLLADLGTGHAIASPPRSSYAFPARRAGEQTIFFTDRALYRPGQTIHYKGVSIAYDQDTAHYSTLAQREVTVVFHDANGKENARAVHRTNDFGSFHGTFTAPRDRLTGSMSIQALGIEGIASIRVEEYKRPKFRVELAAPVQVPRLDAPVELTGTATSYTGAVIGNASVRWRVVRNVHLPSWCWWWEPPESKAIAHGTATTAADGTFTITFPATPDRTVPAKLEPVFTFTLHADVTDTNGETRSAERRLRAGYTAMRATVSAGDWQTPDEPVRFSLHTTSLDGEPTTAHGTVTIHALKQPDRVERAPLEEQYRWSYRPVEDPPVDPSNPDSWNLGEVVAQHSFSTDDGTAELDASLPAGIYRAVLETTDRFGQTVTARHTVRVIDPTAPQCAIRVPHLFQARKWSLEPGETFVASWGTGYETGRAFVELECNGRPLQAYWTAPDRTQAIIKQTITEDMRGGLSVRITQVRENRAYLDQHIVHVPWTNKRLNVTWERFRSKLLPGGEEAWIATVTGPDAEGAAVEMVATLYDASLDQFQPHAWTQTFPVFRSEHRSVWPQFQNHRRPFRYAGGSWSSDSRSVDWSYRTFPEELVRNFLGYETVVLSPFEVSKGTARAYHATTTLAGTRANSVAVNTRQFMADVADASAEPPPTPSGPDLDQVTARRNLAETAFFFPQLVARDDGAVQIRFTVPEALTEWRFFGFAHDRDLRAGFITDTIVTAKDLMVTPNPPRFVREGDELEFTVKVTNQSEATQAGRVRLTFADAATLESRDDALENREIERAFEIPPKQSRSYAWRIRVPDGLGFLTYKAVAATETLSDGEEGFLPVLSRRIRVIESLALPIRGRTTKHFEFSKLLESGTSETIRHQALTVQMVSQPAWYAVLALPYLMEFPHACSEQVFNRLYANALARHIAASDPKIRRIFELWKNTPALDSPLEKNEELKSVLLEETPWLREATGESAARRRVGLLFDANRLEQETAAALHQLAEQQREDGLWPWFPGGRPDEYISLYIVTGFGRLRHLGVEVDATVAVKALSALDAWMTRRYREIIARNAYVPSAIDALYLYGRSFFLADQPVAPPHQEAVEFYLRQSRRFWLQLSHRQSQAHLALALQRFGDQETPQAIMRSIRERAVVDDELGMFWRDLELNWWWYRAPIETQAMMIEAFAEVADDAAAVANCKVWLLKQKQTQDWKTTKATADAVYALLLRGENLLTSDALVTIALGGKTIQPQNVEAGTGFYEERFIRGEINPAMGTITVTKVDAGASWGSIHWDYLEDVARITPHEATPLRLRKTLFVKETTSKGPVLRPINGPVAVGDELVVRIEVRTDRDMEYVHMQDQRGSGTEPVNVLSRYRYQDGLAYYESTRDTASHFFIDYLPKGTYVFEYSTRVQLEGSYQTGIASIQCMYAPEFNSHSESFVLEVK